MRAWAFMLGGLLLWAGHFFALYAVASIFPGMAIARLATLGLTVLAAAAAAFLLWRALGAIRAPGTDPLTGWMAGLAAASAGLGLVAILYQGAPALVL